MEERTDNKQGWYNFKKWYFGKKVVKENLEFHISLSPNKFLSNTYLFQESPNLNYVIGITPIRNEVESIANNSKEYLSIMKQIFEDNFEIDELLIPENIIEK